METRVALMLLWHLFALAWGAHATTREVLTQSELLAAFNDKNVSNIVMASSSWNFTDEELPLNSIILSGKHRNVVLEGKTFPDGKQTYVDGNRLVTRVFVTDGATLWQRKLWVDDCFNPTLDTFPYTCFSETTGGGARVGMQDMTVSDATCTNIANSAGISAMLSVIKLLRLVHVASAHQIDERTVHIVDTGWVPYVPPTAFWRLVNVNLTCTGNITHILPPQDLNVVVRGWQGSDVVAALLSVMALMLTLMFLVRKRWLAKLPAEYGIARAHGYELLEMLGRGRSGVVYRAQHMISNQIVAIKVMTMRATSGDCFRTACRECTINSSIKHRSCIRVITYYSSIIERSGRSTPASSVDKSWVPGANTSSSEDYSDDIPDSKSRSVDSSNKSSRTGSGFGGASGLQVHLVLEFADQGSLAEAVDSGRLLLPDEKPNLPYIVATALEIAEGIAALHHPTARLIHRDLSPSNILLLSDATERGFRAVVSDFGVSTILATGASHRTSDAKGSLAYMPPELFSHDLVSASLDVYSFGVLLLYMLTGTHPYGAWTPARVIGHKLGATSGNQLCIPAWLLSEADDNVVIAQLIDLMRMCTRVDRKQRPTAEGVVLMLRAIAEFGDEW